MPEAEIPLRLRGGLRAYAERKRINARERFRYHVREPLAARGRDGDVNAAFYCVADERYFLGAVGLVNSLRLVGHGEPIFLLDCGLTTSSASCSSREVTLVAGPTDAAPHVLKTIAPLRHPAEVDGADRHRHDRRPARSPS